MVINGDSSSEEDEKVATIAIQESSKALRLFKNLSNDDGPTPHICLMAKHEKVKSKSMSHPVLEGKPNANHVRARISNSRTQQLHNWTSSHSAKIMT